MNKEAHSKLRASLAKITWCVAAKATLMDTAPGASEGCRGEGATSVKYNPADTCNLMVSIFVSVRKQNI